MKVDTAAVPFETVLEGVVAVWLPRPAFAHSCADVGEGLASPDHFLVAA